MNAGHPAMTQANHSRDAKSALGRKSIFLPNVEHLLLLFYFLFETIQHCLYKVATSDIPRLKIFLYCGAFSDCLGNTTMMH